MANHIWVIESKGTAGWLPTAYSYWNRHIARMKLKAIRVRDPIAVLRLVKYVRSEPRQTRSKRRSPEVATPVWDIVSATLKAQAKGRTL